MAARETQVVKEPFLIERLEPRTLLAATAGVAFGGVVELANVDPLGIDQDGAGNVYVAGGFTGGVVDFDPRRSHAMLLDGQAFTNYFVAKYTAGGRLVWARDVGMPIGAMAVGADGATLIARGGAFTIPLVTGVQVEKLTARGRVAWVSPEVDNPLAPGSEADVVDIAVSPAGDVVATGALVNDAGRGVAFASKFAGASGVPVVTRTLGPRDDLADAVAALPDGSFAIAGSLELGSHQDPYDAITHRTFVTHVDADLEPIWHYQVGGPTAGWPAERIDKVAAGRDGSIYVGGEFSGTGEFWPGAAGRIDTGTISQQVSYVARYDRKGQFRWVRQVEASPFFGGWSVEADPRGGVVVASMFEDSLASDLDPGKGEFPVVPGPTADAVLTRLDARGAFAGAAMFGGKSGRVYDKTLLSVGADGRAAVLGKYSGEVDFDPGAGVTARHTTGENTSTYLDWLTI